MLRKIAKKLAIGTAALALTSIGTAASAHLVQFGWEETPTGTVLWGEHWHGDLGSAYTANGGITITDVNTLATITAQWTGVQNNTAVGALGLTGSTCAVGNAGCNTYNDWMFTVAIPLGNGVYDFITGPQCCIDTMFTPVRVTITGITTQPPGIGGVPEPSTWAMMLIGFGATGYAMRRRRSKVVATPQLA